MGGPGSGSWHRWNLGSTVEDCLTLDINRLVKDGLIDPDSRAGSLSWTRIQTGRQVASVGCRLDSFGPDDATFRLSYTVGRGGNKRPIEEAIRLQTTRPYFGGTRWWFTCPNCDRRAAKLHSPPGGDLFLCRTCYGLTYQSQRESPYYRGVSKAQKIRLKLGGSQYMLEPFPEKPKGMHWRTYLRLFRKARAAEEKSWMVQAVWLDKRTRSLGLSGGRGA